MAGRAALRERCLSVRELQDITGVHTRDIRVLNERGGEAFRALIQPRGHHAVLLRMGMFRAVLTAERFLMFRASESARLFARRNLLPIANETLVEQPPPSAGESLPKAPDVAAGSTASADETMRQGEWATQCFEMRCLAAVLAVTQRRLRRRAQCFGPVVERLLDQVVSEEPEHALTELLSVQRALSELERGCESVVHCIDGLLQNDDEMLSLLLTLKRCLPEGSLPPSIHHDDVEALLESYHYSFKEVSDQLFLNIRAIEATQRAVQISLESKRTRLLNLNVHISIATVSLASVATVSSIFGMNLVSGLENTPGMFVAMTTSSMVLAVLVYATYVTFLRSRERTLHKKLQRMAALREISEEMPLLTDIILGQIEVISKMGVTTPSCSYTGSHMLPEFASLASPDKEVKNYLTLDDFRQLCQSEVMAKDSVPDAEIVKLFEILDSDDNGRLEHQDVAEFLCIQSSPLSGLGPAGQ